jgi:excisionase family DNA binding protein
MTAPALLTVAEAAETLRCSRTRVFELLASGVLVRGRRFGRRTVILAESVFAALEQEYHPPAPPKRVRKSGSLKERLQQAWVNAQTPMK